MKTLANLTLAALLAASAFVGCSEQTTEQTSAKPTPTEIAYVASTTREPFHKPDCKWAQKIASSNLQTFSTRAEAIKAGHRPCKVCKP